MNERLSVDGRKVNIVKKTDTTVIKKYRNTEFMTEPLIKKNIIMI